MKQDFEDIRSRVAENPSWFDQNGTPRYGRFAPEATPNIYVSEVALLEIACQSCQERFQVELHHPLMSKEPTLAELIRARVLHYGDPPAHGCCGDTMNSIPLRVLEFWHRPDLLTAGKLFERAPALEVEVKPEWASDVPTDESPCRGR